MNERVGRMLILDRLGQYWYLMRFHRPIGILLLLWPTLWALWIAGEGRPNAKVVTIFVLGVILMRAAGCVINDYADRHFDPHVSRTRDRPIASGKIRPVEALILFGLICLVAFALVLQLNLLTIALSLVAVILAASYPFMKRFTHLPQAYLGLAFGWAVPMAFAAQTGTIPETAWWLLLATVLWAIAYDTMYAMVDREDDLRIGVKSTAILFGGRDRLIIAGVQITMFICLAWAGYQEGLNGWYGLGLLAAAGLALYQQTLIHDRSPERCFKAFLNNNWVGAAIFLGILFDYGF